MGIRNDLESSDRYIPILLWLLLVFINVMVLLANENTFNTGRCGCGGLLVIVNRASHVSFFTKPRSFWTWDLLDARHLVTSYLVPSFLLLVIRMFSFTVFCFTVLWQELGPPKYASDFPGKHGEWLTYFENWIFVGFGLYSILGVLVSVQAWFAPTLERYQISDTARPLNFFDRIFLLTASCVGTCAVAMTAMYWGFIYDWDEARTPYVDEVLRNGGPVVLVLLDVLLSRMPIVSYHFIVSVWFGSAYLLLMWIWYFVNATWRYKQLSWDGPSAFWHYAVALACLVGGSGVLFLVAFLREAMFNCGVRDCLCHPLSCCASWLPASCTGKMISFNVFDAVPQILIGRRGAASQHSTLELLSTPPASPWISRRSQPSTAGATPIPSVLGQQSPPLEGPTPTSSGIGRYRAPQPSSPPSVTPSFIGRYASKTPTASAPPSASPSVLGRYGASPAAALAGAVPAAPGGIGRYVAPSGASQSDAGTPRRVSRGDAGDSYLSNVSGEEMQAQKQPSDVQRLATEQYGGSRPPSDIQRRSSDVQRRPSDVQRRLVPSDADDLAPRRPSATPSAGLGPLRAPPTAAGSSRGQQPLGSGRRRDLEQAW